MRPRDGLIVEKGPDFARRWFPADVLHLARSGPAAVIAVGLGRVVVVPRFGFPRARRMGVERPVRNIYPAHAVDERALLQRARREPLARVPAADLLPHLALRDLEREQRLRPDRCLDLGG